MLMLILVFFIAVFFLKFFSSRNDESNRNFEKIPGPKGLPFLGNIQDYFRTDEDIWLETRRRAIEFYPIYKLKALNKRIIHLVDPKDIEVILSNPKYMEKGETYEPFKYWLGDGILVSKHELWRRSRKVLTKCFHFKALQNNMNLMNSATLYLTSVLEGEKEKPSDLNSHLNDHTLRIALGAMVGEKLAVKKEAAKRFLQALRTLTKITSLKILLPLMNRLYKFTPLKKKEDDALKIYRDFTSYFIAEKSNLKTEDLDETRALDALIQNYEGQDINSHFNTLIFGGQDSTSTALTFILYVLANKPHFQDEIYEEIMQITSNGKPTYGEISQMNFLDRFVKECFRMYPPAHFIGRNINEDILLPSGYTIPARALFFIDIFDVHRNPQIHPEPDKFDPDRFLPENIRKRHPYSFIPFSAGPRNCIAQKFATLEVKTTICAIMKKFRLEPVGSLEDIIIVPDVLLKTKYPLKVIFRPRLI